MALRELSSEELEFKCIEVGMSNPIVWSFPSFADEYLKYKPINGFYCHSEYLEKNQEM